MRPKLISGAAVATLAFMALSDSAHATDYRFHVNCQARNFVVQWNTGTIDPGKEYLRVITGTKNPNCGVTDFDGGRDGNLPVERYSDWGGVIQGLPPVRLICGILGC
jgi:hypothetical protein